MITKTDYLSFLDTPMHLWAVQHGRIEVGPSPYEQHLMQQGYEIEILARQFLKDWTLQGSGAELSPEETFQDGDFQARVDLAARYPPENLLDIYEIKSASSIQKEHLYDVAFQRLVCEASEKVRDVYLVHVNKEYTRGGGELDLQDMFEVVNLNDEVESLREEVQRTRDLALQTAKMEDPESIPTCLKPKTCPCPSLCHPDLPERSIFEVPRLHKNKTLELRSIGVITIPDIPDDFQLSDLQSQHVKTVKTGQALINKQAILDELSRLEYPLNFLDYETYNPGKPIFPGYKPHQHVVYQYSLHVLKDPEGELEHYESLQADKEDPGFKLAENLSGHMPARGSVIVWNRSFEAGRNQEMAERYPPFRDRLLDINDRIFDLMDIFKKGYYIHPDFRGSASIKNVLPVLVPDFAGRYAELPISNGEEAMLAWGELQTGELSPDQEEQIRCSLLKYCELDTLAMVKIWEKLRKIIGWQY